MNRHSWGEDGMYKSAHGEFVLYTEVQAEIERLKAEINRLKSCNTERNQIDALLDNNPHALARMELHKRLSQPEPKNLEQSFFDGAPDWVEYAAISPNGFGRFYEVGQEVSGGVWVCKKWPVGQSLIIDSGFDASDWENSLIKRYRTEGES